MLKQPLPSGMMRAQASVSHLPAPSLTPTAKAPARRLAGRPCKAYTPPFQSFDFENLLPLPPPVEGSSLCIRNATLTEWQQTACRWGNELHSWNLGVHDGVVLFAVDPSGIFVAEIAGEIVGCVTGVKIGADKGYVGYYMVVERHRGHGIGRTLFGTALQHLHGRCIGLDAVEAQIDNYTKCGFFATRYNARYKGCFAPPAGGAAPPPPPHPAVQLTQLSSELHLEQLSLLDTEAVGLRRPDAFFRAFLGQPGTRGVCALDAASGRMRGCLVLRAAADGYRAGPWYATDKSVAHMLMHHALSDATLVGQPLYLDLPEDNPDAVSLAEGFGMERLCVFNRMWTSGPEVAEDLTLLYAALSVEFG